MMPDRIILHGMVFYGYHGQREEERRLGQRFEVDVEMEADLRAAGNSDRLEDTLDYGRAYQVVREVLEGAPYHLLEAVAEAVAARLLAALPASAAIVRVRKAAVPLPGPIAYAAVEVVRRRNHPSTG